MKFYKLPQDITAEIRKAQQWLTDNHQRRKTAKGMPKFLNGWLSRAGNGNGHKATSGLPPPNRETQRQFYKWQESLKKQKQ